ncbi:stage II sporulation protein M [Kurthia sp. Dielmo]|uniref:stage II sporulation protein M n=1 Tax=Kurthia sp. Dielmo TaxID=1033738 RepID=UPI00164590B5|nr:stage II sporulation protein M [Kurthia sp. Dielmo]
MHRQLFSVFKKMKLEISLAFIVFVIGAFLGALMGMGQDEVTFVDNTASATAILQNNLKACVIIFSGFVLLGIPTFISLLFNGLILGSTLKASSFYLSGAELLQRGAPHAILEIPGIVLAGAVGFQTVRILINIIRNKKVSLKEELMTASVAIIAAVICISLAALVEGFITVKFI